MLAVIELGVHFAGRYLFSDVSYLIKEGDRIGLAGRNGAGKSTMLKILAGVIEPDEGELAGAKDMTLGYLPQEMDHQGGRTVREEARQAFHEVLLLEKEMELLEKRIAEETDYTSDAYMDLLHKHHEVQERYGAIGGYSIEGDVERVLLGLGFLREDLERITDEFSGGWRMRIELAKILLQKPDLLLLDEPTNHLDIESIQWLEGFLKNYSGSIVLVSHDKVFLDTITNRTIEISMGRIEDYNASYTRYLDMREERRTLQSAAKENQQKRIDELERFVERFKAKASKAKQAQSRVKMLEKIDRIETEEEDTAKIRFRFPDPPRSGALAVEAEHLYKNYGEKKVLRDLEFQIERGEKIAFVGKNGEGKSTLSKIIAGRESFEGMMNLGHNIHLGYFAQNQAETLDPEKTVFQTIDDAATGEMRLKVRSLLGAFLFSGEAADKKVKVLSGGEKGRLALAKLLLDPINLLVLDEPTNHLDMRAKDVLKEALQNYTGTMVVVSHDRDFLQGLTNKVYEFRGGKLKMHYGDVYDYLKARKMETLDDLQKKSPEKEAIAEPAPKKEKEKAKEKDVKGDVANKLNNEERKARERARKAIEKKISEAEAQIEVFETRNSEIEKELSGVPSLGRQQELLGEYDRNKAKIASLMADWEKLGEEAEAFSN